MDYLIIVLSLGLISFLIECIFHEHLFHSLKERITWVVLFNVVGISWDIYAVNNQHWVFPGNGLLGIYVWNLPIEEFLWFLVVPYFCLTIYKTTHIIFDKKRQKWKR